MALLILFSFFCVFVAFIIGTSVCQLVVNKYHLVVITLGIILNGFTAYTEYVNRDPLLVVVKFDHLAYFFN